MEISRQLGQNVGSDSELQSNKNGCFKVFTLVLKPHDWWIGEPMITVLLSV